MDNAAGQRIALDQLLARLVVRRLRHLPITPNLLTLLSLIVGLGAAWRIAQGGNSIHWGAAMFIFAAWLDHWDGEFARQTGQTSEFGHYFDYAAALVNYCALFIGIGYGVRDSWIGASAAPMGIVAGLAVLMIFLLRFWVELRDGRSAIRQAVFGGFEIEDTLYIVGPITWLGWLPSFLVVATVGAPIFLTWIAYDAFIRKAGAKYRSNA